MHIIFQKLRLWRGFLNVGDSMDAGWQNELYFGDNLDILREQIADESVDLIYLDPPFNSNATYNVLFREKGGEESAAQITAFEDTWHWSLESEDAFREVVTDGPERLGRLLQVMRDFLGQNDMMAYLTMMAQRIAELHRVLKPTGSLYLHCDPTASHYLKLLLDSVCGKENFKNEIVWKRTSAHGGAKRWGPIHDVILFYTASNEYRWNRLFQEYTDEYLRDHYRREDSRGRYQLVSLTGAGKRRGDSGKAWRGVDPTESGRHWAVPRSALQNAYPNRTDLDGLSTQEKLDLLDAAGLIYWPPTGNIPRQKRYADENPGVPIQDIIADIPPIGAQARERLSYPTQKPEALLERIIEASSNEGDVVLDPFCGCGTAVAAAERLNRRWMGIDVTHLAITLIRHRMSNSFGEDLRPYEVIGDPKDLPSARALAQHDRYQFEWWALGLVDARPARDKRKGADRGIDGYINFFDDNSGKAKRVVVQVKSGNVSVSQVRDLKGAMERERAQMGIFITLKPPTRPMGQEAISAGFYAHEHFRNRFPCVQILTIEELLAGAKAQYPRYALQTTFKRAPRRRREEGGNVSLLF